MYEQVSNDDSLTDRSKQYWIQESQTKAFCYSNEKRNKTGDVSRRIECGAKIQMYFFLLAAKFIDKLEEIPTFHQIFRFLDS